MIQQLVGTYVALLVVACAVALAVKWIRLPYTIALVLVGLVLAFLKLAPGVVISKEVTFTLILPPLLFYGALQMDLEALKRNWATIAALAVPGVVLSTLIIGVTLHWLWGVGLMVALLFGALMTPTDPISVLAICREVGAPKRLRLILEGESLFNDGTGIVIFGVLFGLATGHGAFHWGETVLEFVKVVLGGAVIGAGLGYLVYRILGTTEDHLVEVALTIVLAFGAPLVAEAVHVSGVIATVVAGLVIGNYGRIFSMSDKAREAVEHTWEVIDFLVNSVLFLLIGLELQAISLAQLKAWWVPILWALLVVQVARALTAYPVVWIQRRLRPRPLPRTWAHAFYWGGLKGSIPLALVVGMPSSLPYRDLLLTAAFACVLVSLVAQGSTMKLLLVRLGLTVEE